MYLSSKLSLIINIRILKPNAYAFYSERIAWLFAWELMDFFLAIIKALKLLFLLGDKNYFTVRQTFSLGNQFVGQFQI